MNGETRANPGPDASTPTVAAWSRPDKNSRRCARCGHVAPIWYSPRGREYEAVAPTLVDRTRDGWTGPLPTIEVELRDGDQVPYRVTAAERYVPAFRCRDAAACVVDGVPARPAHLPWDQP